MNHIQQKKIRIAMMGQKGMPATWGGVEQHVHHLALQCVALGHQVTVYSRAHYADKKAARVLEKEHPGLRIPFLPTLATKHFDAIVSVCLGTLHAMIFIRPDIYHYHGVGPSLVAFLPRIFSPRSRVIVTFHSSDRDHAKWGRFAKKVLTFAEWTAVHIPHQTITVSHTLQDYARLSYGVETHYIPNGVEIPPLASGVNDMRTLESFGLVAQGYALIVTRLVPHKGTHYAIDAWSQLQTEKKLVIVGDAVMGTEAYVEELRERAARDARIVFTGFQAGEDLVALYRHAYITMHPSDAEGLSISLLEAASYGKGIVASNIAPNMEIIEHGGFAFEAGKIEALVETLQFVIAHPHAVKIAGRSARAFVTEYYQWRNIAEKTLDVYYQRNADTSQELL